MFRPLWIVVIICAVVLTACSGASTTPTPTSVPVEVPTESPPTAPPPTQAPTATPSPEPTVSAVVPPPSPQDAGVLPLENIYLDAVGLSDAWGQTLAPGTAYNRDEPPSNNGLPPHVLVSFGGPGTEIMPDPNIVEPGVPQGRIFPIAAYIDMYQQAGSEFPQASVDALKVILVEQPATSDGPIPFLPGFGDARQVVQGKLNYIDFNGGSGVGYVAAYGQDVGAITDDKLVYLFQGISRDGEHYVSFLWPLSADFLPDHGGLAQEENTRAATNIDQYLSDVNQQVAESQDSNYTPVLTALNQMMQSLVIGEAALGEQPTSTNIFNIKWQWTRFLDNAGQNSFIIDDPQNYQLIFWNDGAYWLQADCNTGGGSYIMNGSLLTLEPGAISLAECGPESRSTQYLQYLGNVASYVSSQGELFLNLKADAGNMVFSSAGPFPYDELVTFGRAQTVGGAGSTSAETLLIPWGWQWETFTDPLQSFAVGDPQKYTVTFQPDGSLNVIADCNNALGSYTLDGNSISIELGATTLAACPPGSLSDQFLQYLSFAAIYFFEEDRLFIDLFADGGTMQFSPASPAATIPGTPLTSDPVFFDDFGPGSGWFAGDYGSYSFSFVDGAYQIFVEPPDTPVRSVRGQVFDNLRAQVEASRLSGPVDGYFGLVCRHLDGSNYYALLIASDGSYAIAKKAHGADLEIIEGGTADEGVISLTGVNRVRADCIDEHLVLYANDVRLADYQDQDFTSGEVGMTVWTQANPSLIVQFDNFAIYNP